MTMSERRRAMALRRQLRHTSPLLIAWSLGALVLLAVGVQDSASVEELFLDPAHITGAPWYTGLIANLGILAWTVAAVSAAGGAWVSLRAGRPSAMTFLASGALVTSLLLLDDLLQLHAVILPSTGMAPTAAQFMVVAPTLLWAWMHRHEIARTRWLLLLAAFAGFGLSLVADQIGGTGSTRLFVEDGAKLLGVFAWAQYFVWTTRDITGSVIDAALGLTDRAWGIEEPVRVR
jgi:hypothetical protein